ncbi:protein RST1 isoform X2 [Asparagus officinalis]|uniref:protein RST1 isoform X2 n=1 Tax=Asparagus officinalis TaxID=4686 RepID=UPI00098E7C12|nr:protein RST1 isoform X2 [Asparagus officinalis]
MSNSSPYSSLLSKLRLPQPQLSRQAVTYLFKTLTPNLSSAAARDAISQCLRELCRLFSLGLVDRSVALLEIQSALEGCDARFVGVLVKGLGFLCRFGFGTDGEWRMRRFDTVELHPFVKVLACREEVQAELIQQVLLFIAHNRTVGMEAVTWFLRPFLMFSVIHKPSQSSSSFARDLISAVASLCCSFPSEAISIIKLLTECLRFFPCTNVMEFKHLINSAEYVVDAYVGVLNEIVGAKEQSTSTIQVCGVEIVDALLSLSGCTHRPYGDVEFMVEQSKRLLIAQKELGLLHLPEFAMIMVSIPLILAQLEFEHEYLSILKLLIFIFEWRAETERNSKGTACCLCEELLYIFPAVSLLSSPSKSVKAAAACLLSTVDRLVSDLLNVPRMTVVSNHKFLCVNKPKSIHFRLLNHLWLQEQSHFPHSTYLGLACGVVYEFDKTSSEPNYWTCQLRMYLQTAEKLKDASFSQSSEDLVAGLIRTYFLLSSIASVLLMHPMLGSSAVDVLATIGLVDSRLCISLLQALLYYNKMLCSHGSNSPELLLRLFEMLPSLAAHSVMVPLILQTVLPMLQKGVKPVLYAAATRLLCKTWITTGQAFGTLQEILDPKALSDFISDRHICISIAGSIRDVCRHNPDRGVDLILSVSSCIESRDSTVRALGFESLAHLCEADVVDFYTAWDVIARYSIDYSNDPIVAHGLCTLLRWGAMDVAAYPESSKTVTKILWDVAISKNRHSASSWVKARASAFKALSQYEVEYLQDTFPDFRQTNLRCLVDEDDTKVLMAMEELEIKIINFDHLNRRRVHTQKRAMVNKVEKLLDVLPQVIFSQGSYRLDARPGAALLSLVFTPKDLQGKSKALAKIHSAYEKALLEISESLHVSRNIIFALLALQSWKTFICRWIREVIMHDDSKGSRDVSDKHSKAAHDIFKILCKAAAEAIPRVAVNIALAIGALCTVVPSTTHSVTSAASDLLLKWLVEHEHEHQQWSAAISLGLVYNCLHATDRAHKSRIITELLKAVNNCKSYLVKGACGVGLGFACQDLLTRIEVDNPSPEGSTARLAETMLLHKTIRTLSTALSQICPSASDSLSTLCENFLTGREDPLSADFLDLPHGNINNVEEDAWGIAGLVLGIGNSVVAIYRSGAYDAVLKIKEMLISWVPQVDSSAQGSVFCREMTEVPLAMGSCLVLPTVMAFCQRTELIDNDSDLIYRYGSLLSALRCSKKSGTLYQNLMMASCVGAGSFVSCILSDGTQSMRFGEVKCLLEMFRDAYTNLSPPYVQFGGMLGVVNVFGAGAGDLTHVYAKTPFQHNIKDSTFIMGSLLSSPICESLSTSTIQELFLLAKESKDQQIKEYSAWAVSFLREKCWSKELQNINPQGSVNDTALPSQNFAEDSLVFKLCLWLRDTDFNKPDKVLRATTVSSILKCLSKAPRLPALDWGSIIRSCMQYGAKCSLGTEQSAKLLREECICFSLTHANGVSSLLVFVDELTDLSRFRTLELNLQCTLLHHLPDLLKIFSGSKLDKLSEELVAYFSSSGGLYLNFDLDQRTLLRVSFWKGLRKCLDGKFKESLYTPNIEKCMECLFTILPVLIYDAKPEAWVAVAMEEWSEAIKCLSKASQDWLMDILQVPDIDKIHGGILVDEVAKRISARARLVRVGCIPNSELHKIKAYLLNTSLEGAWWTALMDVAAAVSTAEGNTKVHWLLNALEISCMAEYPSTALRFVGLLSGICCKYMPLLIVDQDTVLSDLPTTLPCLLAETSWRRVAEPAADKLWISTERICVWAAHLAGNEDSLTSKGGIRDDEALKSTLARSVYETCVALRDYLPVQKQLRLVNLQVSQLWKS